MLVCACASFGNQSQRCAVACEELGCKTPPRRTSEHTQHSYNNDLSPSLSPSLSLPIVFDLFRAATLHTMLHLHLQARGSCRRARCLRWPSSSRSKWRSRSHSLNDSPRRHRGKTGAAGRGNDPEGKKQENTNEIRMHILDHMNWTPETWSHEIKHAKLVKEHPPT